MNPESGGLLNSKNKSDPHAYRIVDEEKEKSHRQPATITTSNNKNSTTIGGSNNKQPSAETPPQTEKCSFSIPGALVSISCRQNCSPSEEEEEVDDDKQTECSASEYESDRIPEADNAVDNKKEADEDIASTINKVDYILGNEEAANKEEKETDLPSFSSGKLLLFQQQQQKQSTITTNPAAAIAPVLSPHCSSQRPNENQQQQEGQGEKEGEEERNWESSSTNSTNSTMKLVNRHFCTHRLNELKSLSSLSSNFENMGILSCSMPTVTPSDTIMSTIPSSAFISHQSNIDINNNIEDTILLTPAAAAAAAANDKVDSRSDGCGGKAFFEYTTKLQVSAYNAPINIRLSNCNVEISTPSPLALTTHHSHQGDTANDTSTRSKQP